MLSAVHILNRLPTNALDEQCHTKPGMGASRPGYLRTFGCLAFVKEVNHVGKLNIEAPWGCLSAMPTE